MDPILYPKQPESYLTRPMDKTKSNFFWEPIPEEVKNGEVMLVFSKRKKVKQEIDYEGS